MQFKKLREIGLRDNIPFAVVRRDDAQTAWFAGSDFLLHSLDLADEKAKPEAFDAAHTSYVTSLRATPTHLVTTGYDRRLIWWDAETRKAVRTVEDAHDRWVRDLAVSPDGSRLATVADDMTCCVWDAESGERLHMLQGHEEQTPHNYPSMLYAVAFSPDGSKIATGDRVGHVVIWDAQSGEQVTTLEAPGNYTWDPRARRHSIGGIRSLAFSPDGKTLAVGGMGKVGNIDHLGGKSRVELFEWTSGKSLLTLEHDKYKGLVETLVWHPSGDWFLAAGGDNGGFFIAYRPDSDKSVADEKAPMHVHDVSLTPDFRSLVAAGHNKLAIYDVEV